MVYQKRENGSFQMLPYDKFLKYGEKALTDEELLAIILRTGTKGEDALTVALHVLALCGKQGLLGLHHLSLADICQVKGIGLVKAVKLKTVAELSLRMANAVVAKDLALKSPQSVADVYMEQMRHLEKEHCIAIYLDANDCRIKDETLSIGDISSAIVSARELFKSALRYNAASIILLHNHPSGNPQPSKADIDVTKQILEASRFMEIPLLDHIIIGDHTYISLKEKGVI